MTSTKKAGQLYTEIHNDELSESRNQLDRQLEVPAYVTKAVAVAVNDVLNNHPGIRDEITKAVASRMGGNWRFCSCYRHKNSPLHALIYAACSTVGANFAADDEVK